MPIGKAARSDQLDSTYIGHYDGQGAWSEAAGTAGSETAPRTGAKTASSIDT